MAGERLVPSARGPAVRDGSVGVGARARKGLGDVGALALGGTVPTHDPPVSGLCPGGTKLCWTRPSDHGPNMQSGEM